MTEPTSRDIHELEQGAALLADMLPPIWRRLYDNCLAQNFTKAESLELVKTYILTGCTVKP